LTWALLQLADSAFPTGGFAHSAGLEAAAQLGPVELHHFARDLVLATATGSLPIVRAACGADPARLAELDAFTAATLWSHVAARASRAQGRAWIDVAARAFGQPPIVELRRRVVAGEQPGHLAPMFGAVATASGIARDEAAAVFLHLTVRGLLSAAVRLGLAGPTEAQALHARLAPVLDDALARDLAVEDVAQTSPLLELVQAGQDRLYSRLFQT
jgi:urease accessory protein